MQALLSRRARGQIDAGAGTVRSSFACDNYGYLALSDGRFVTTVLERGGWKLIEATTREPGLHYPARRPFSQVDPRRSEDDPQEPYTGTDADEGLRAPPRPGIAEELIHRKDRGDGVKRIALTFDACWKQKRGVKNQRTYDSRVIEALRQTGTPATLFLGGYWMKQFPDETRALAEDPLFEIGSHTYQHIHPAQVPTTVLADELRRTDTIFWRLTGGKRMMPLYRPPFGEYNNAARAMAAQCGFVTVHWSVESGDPATGQNADAIYQDCMRAVRPGGVVLMHMNGMGKYTAEALPRLIATLRGQGYTFVKVSEL